MDCSLSLGGRKLRATIVYEIIKGGCFCKCSEVITIMTITEIRSCPMKCSTGHSPLSYPVKELC